MAVTDFLTYIGYPYPDDFFREDNPVNLFGVLAFSAEAHLFMKDLFLQLVRNSDWPRRQKELWIQRYMLGKSLSFSSYYSSVSNRDSTNQDFYHLPIPEVYFLMKVKMLSRQEDRFLK